MTFDIQSIPPEGFEVVGFKPPKEGDIYIVTDRAGIALQKATKDFIFHRIIVKKIWKPKQGEVIAVKHKFTDPWQFRVFRKTREDGAIGCEHPTAISEIIWWIIARPLTPEEKGEV